MTAPTKPARPAAPVPPGLAAILKPLDEYEGPEPFGATVAADLLGVKPRTVVYWATSEQLAGLLISRATGWRFTIPDLRTFLTKRYHHAR